MHGENFWNTSWNWRNLRCHAVSIITSFLPYYCSHLFRNQPANNIPGSNRKCTRQTLTSRNIRPAEKSGLRRRHRSVRVGKSLRIWQRSSAADGSSRNLGTASQPKKGTRKHKTIWASSTGQGMVLKRTRPKRSGGIGKQLARAMPMQCSISAPHITTVRASE